MMESKTLVLALVLVVGTQFLVIEAGIGPSKQQKDADAAKVEEFKSLSFEDLYKKLEDKDDQKAAATVLAMPNTLCNKNIKLTNNVGEPEVVEDVETLEINRFEMAKTFVKLKPPMKHLSVDGANMTKTQISSLSGHLYNACGTTLVSIKLNKIKFNLLRQKVLRSLDKVLTYVDTNGGIEHTEHLAEIFPKLTSVVLEEAAPYTTCEALKGLTRLTDLEVVSMPDEFFAKSADDKKIVLLPKLAHIKVTGTKFEIESETMRIRSKAIHDITVDGSALSPEDNIKFKVLCNSKA